RREETAPAPSAGVDDTEGGDVPLTPIQRWCLAGDPPSPHHFNQWILLDVPADVASAELESALSVLVEHHGAFRLRFSRGAAGWRQWYGEREGSLLYEATDVSGASGRQPEVDWIESLQGSLDLERGPIAWAVLRRSAGAHCQLLLVAHHLVVDVVS